MKTERKLGEEGDTISRSIHISGQQVVLLLKATKEAKMTDPDHAPYS